MPLQEPGDHGDGRVTARGPWRLTELRATDLRFIHVLSEAGAHGKQVEIQELLTGVVGSDRGLVPVTATHFGDGDCVLQAHGTSSYLCQGTNVCLCSSLSRTSPRYWELACVHHLLHCDFPLGSLQLGVCWRPQLACELQHLPEG